MNNRTGAGGVALALMATLALGACGDETDAALETAPHTTAIAADEGCGAALPITGLCSRADPAYFLRINEQAPKLANGCVWRTHEASFSADTALVFRAQDCTAEGWAPYVYSFVQGYVKYRMDGTPEDQALFILEIVPLLAGESAERAAMKTLDKAPEEQRTRCEVRQIEAPVAIAGSAFSLAPTTELAAEMQVNSGGEPWDACGPNGVTMDAVQFWEARNGYALFHMLGQDDPQWDPASFTFYRKGADGGWAKAG